MMHFKNYFHHYIYILLGFVILGSDGLKNVILAGPYFIRRGEDVFLTCQYDMEKDQLYAVKWYRGASEFYRYVPKEAPPQKVFLLRDHHMNIDVHHSNSHQILVRNVSLNLSGTYRCVVSAEATFQTLSDERNIMVVAIGYDVPRLQLDRSSYHPGDFIHANCSAGKTFPGPNITWYLNDVQNQLIKPTTTFIVDELDEPPITTTFSKVSFNLPESYLPSKLTCRVQLMDVYSELSTKKIQPVPRNFTFIGGVDGGGVTRSSKSSTASKSKSNSIATATRLDSYSSSSAGLIHRIYLQYSWTSLLYFRTYFRQIN